MNSLPLGCIFTFLLYYIRGWKSNGAPSREQQASPKEGLNLQQFCLTRKVAEVPVLQRCETLGSVITNLAPPVSLFSTRMSPPKSEIISWTAGRPKPVPASLVVK